MLSESFVTTTMERLALENECFPSSERVLNQLSHAAAEVRSWKLARSFLQEVLARARPTAA